MKMRFKLWSLILVIAFGVSFSYAADNGVVVNQDLSERSFSASDIQFAKAFVNPLRPPDTTSVVPDITRGVTPGGVMTKAGVIRDNDDIETRAYGSFGVPYTTTRVQDGSTTALGVTNSNRLSTTTPYRMVGKLVFSQGYCSASLIRKSVIVTAAHCIQRFGSGSSTYSGWTFIPGHYGAGATTNQLKPYGEWNWYALIRPLPWMNGTDKGSGAARDNDLALIVLKKNSSNQFIGDRIGYFGYGWNNYSFISSSRTGNKNTAAVSTLGYPGKMDAGRIMQRTDGPSYTTTISNAGQIYQGSNFTGGSSGGPWIVNFRSSTAALSGGAAPGAASTMSVIGVTSWGTADPNIPKDNYSSQFRQNSAYPGSNYGGYGAGNIGYLMNTLCNYKPPGSSLTFKQMGYCN